MRKTKIFHSFSEYENWTERFNECSEYEAVPVIIDEKLPTSQTKISCDMFIECKSYKTALRHFEKAFANYKESVSAWIECIKDSCENGCFKMRDKSGKYDFFGYEIEQISENAFYISLVIAGIYAE